MQKDFEKFTISQDAILIRDSKCLILEFTNKPGKWGLPGGRIDKGEMADKAFRREIREEIGLKEFNIISVVDYDIWYVRDKKPVSGIVCLIENKKDKIKLSDEHSDCKWVTEKEAENYVFLWPNALRMIKKGFAYKRLLEKINEQK